MKNDNSILMGILWLYLIVGQISMLYFWYLYSQEHSFLNTIIIGPFIAEIKGLLFPFFLEL
jgi:hypothetical protein